jgi:hypothetical protein
LTLTTSTGSGAPAAQIAAENELAVAAIAVTIPKRLLQYAAGMEPDNQLAKALARKIDQLQ